MYAKICWQYICKTDVKSYVRNNVLRRFLGRTESIPVYISKSCLAYEVFEFTLVRIHVIISLLFLWFHVCYTIWQFSLLCSYAIWHFVSLNLSSHTSNMMHCNYICFNFILFIMGMILLVIFIYFVYHGNDFSNNFMLFKGILKYGYS